MDIETRAYICVYQNIVNDVGLGLTLKKIAITGQ